MFHLNCQMIHMEYQDVCLCKDSTKFEKCLLCLLAATVIGTLKVEIQIRWLKHEIAQKTFSYAVIVNLS